VPARAVQSDAVSRVRVNYQLCHYCGACVAVCPPEAILLFHSTLIIDPQACTLCERCLHACPTQALAKEGAGGGAKQ
jgi:ferredoxin